MKETLSNWNCISKKKASYMKRENKGIFIHSETGEIVLLYNLTTGHAKKNVIG